MKPTKSVILGAAVALVISGCATTVTMKAPEPDATAEAVAQESGWDAGDAGQVVAMENLPPYTTRIITQDRPIYVPLLDSQGRVVKSSPASAADGATADAGSEGMGLPGGRERNEAMTMLDAIGDTKKAVDGATQFPLEWDGGSVSYDYNPSFQYRVYTTPLRITSIDLEPEELVMGELVLSDLVRWKVGTTVSVRNGKKMQSIQVKPDAAGLQTSLIINTDHRRYFVLLYSTDSVYMLNVRWNYTSQLPTQWLAPMAPLSQKAALDTPEGAGQASEKFIEGVNYKYKLSYWDINGAPYWMPLRVYDDGEHTYFLLPKKVLPNRKLPALSLADSSVIAYRTNKNVLIADVIEKEFKLFLNGTTVNVVNEGFN